MKGSIAGAKHVHELAKSYNSTVILHTDHAARKLLPWVDGLLDESERHYSKHGKPLFSSHMIDLPKKILLTIFQLVKNTLRECLRLI